MHNQSQFILHAIGGLLAVTFNFGAILSRMVRISKSFLKSSLIYTVAGAMPMASAIILLPLYLHYLSAETYGALSIYLSLSLLVQILVTYGFDTSLYVHFHELKKDKSELSVFISSAFILMFLFSVVVSIVLFFAGDFIFRNIFTEEGLSFFPYGLISLGSGILQAIIKVYSSLVQSREMPETFLWTNLIYFFLIVSFTFGGLYFFPDSLTGPVSGRFLAGVITGVWVLFRIYREFGLHLNFAWLKRSFSFNNYLFIYQIQQWIINYSDRTLMVLFNVPLAYVGVYDFTLKCLLVIEFFAGGAHNAILPKVLGIVVSQPEKKSTIEINRYYNGLTALVMILVCASIFGFPVIIEWLKEDEYRDVLKYLPYAALLYLLRALRLYFLFPYSVLKYSKPLPVFYIIVVIVKIAGIVILVDDLKVYGVIIASLASALVEVVLLRYGIGGKFKFQFNLFKMIYSPGLLFLLILVLEPSLGHVNRNVVHAFYLLFSIAMLWWVYRSELRTMDVKNIFGK